jgi:hypothetical protein
MWGVKKIILLYLAGTCVLQKNHIVHYSRAESLTLSDLKKPEVLKLA